MGQHHYIGIDTRHGPPGALRLGSAYVGSAMHYLALQIAYAYSVGVGHSYRANTGGGKIERHRRPESAGANDQHAGRGQRTLSRKINLAQIEMTHVSLVVHDIYS